MRLPTVLCLLMLPLLGAAASDGVVVLLGQKENIPFDDVKALHIARTVDALLRSCTVATKVDSIPVVTYKGVRVMRTDDGVVEAHIFPDSTSSYMVKIYTRESGVIKMHSKYTDHAYQLIGMLELDRRHLASASTPGSNPICWKAPRIYQPTGAFAGEIKLAAGDALKLQRVVGTLPKSSTLSPNGTYAFHQSQQPHPDRAGSTKASLLISTETPRLLSVETSGVFNVVDTKWLNEKLIFFRVWLGRHHGVDVILDVEQDRFVLMEAIADGRLLWEQANEACKANPNFPECKAVCR